jgi:hypothetical protein
VDTYLTSECSEIRSAMLIAPQSEDREFLAVSGEVKSTKIQGSQIKLGVQFMDADGHYQSVLSTLVPALRFQAPVPRRKRASGGQDRNTTEISISPLFESFFPRMKD